jgi:hypothetical protein
MKTCDINVNAVITETGISVTIQTDGHGESALGFTIAQDRALDIDVLTRGFVEAIENTAINFIREMSDGTYPGVDDDDESDDGPIEGNDDHLKN